MRKSVLCPIKVAVVFAIVTLLVAAPLAAKSLEDANWIEVVTPNFQIMSALDERKTVDLVRHLELLREAVSRLTNIESTVASIPTIIYAFRSEKDFDLLGIKGSTVGIFQDGIRNNTILIRGTTNMDESSIIMHEYVHFLLRNHGGFDYPRWYNEGFAEYFGASEVRGDKFRVGGGADHRMTGLVYGRWIASDELLSSGAFSDLGRADRSMFYGQAWLLVHYLQHAERSAVTVADGMSDYAFMTAAGSSELESFEEAFQIEAASLRRTLDTYMRKECCALYNIPIEKLLPDFSPTARRMARAEVALGLGQLALSRDKLEIAEQWFAIALTSELTRTRALSDMAQILYFRDEDAKAEQQLNEGVALAPNDPVMHLNMAAYWLKRATSASLPSTRNEFLGFARNSILAAWKIDDSIPDIYVMNGLAVSMQGKDPGKAIEMFEEGARLLPANSDIQLLLARAYASAELYSDAIKAAKSVLAWSHGEDDVTEAAQKLIEEIEELHAEKTTKTGNDRAPGI